MKLDAKRTILIVFASFISMGYVRHGDNRVVVKKGLEAFDVED